MKKIALSALLLLSTLGSSQAATLYATNLGNGVTFRNGLSAFATGTLRFGTFPANFDVAANANNITALEDAFIEIYSRTGALNAFSTNGFFQISQSYDTGLSYGGLPYDASAGSVEDVAGDIAGSRVYVWLHNNASPAAASEQIILVTDQTWTDADEVVTDTVVSPDTGAAGLAIVVGQNATGADLGAGAPSHRAGGVFVSLTITRSPGSTSVTPGTAVTFSSQLVGGLSVTYQWRKNGQDLEGQTGPQLVIASATANDSGDYELVATSGSNVLTSNELNLTVADAPPATPQIVQQPASLIVPLNGSIDLSVGAIGAGTLSYQWKKGANIAGATTASISIPDATLKSAGAYNVVVSNGTGTATSQKVEVAVVDTSSATIPVVLNGTAKLSINAAGKGLTYQWYKEGVIINDTKATKKTYSVKVTDPSLAGAYTCVVSGPGGSLEGGVQNVVLVSEAPAFTSNSITLPAGVVGGDYSVSIYDEFMDQNPAKTPLSFRAAKLPAGLRIDAKTGVISGRPTKATGGAVTATITASTGKGLTAAVASASITISEFPSGLAGTYVAAVEVDDVVGSGLGGRVDFTVTTQGALSGKLLLGGDKVVAFKGAVNVGLEGNPVIEVTIPRKTSYLPLKLTAEVNTTTGLLVDATLSQEGGSADLEGWRNTNVGAAYAGLTTFGLQIPAELEGNVAIPQGVSHGTLNVKAPAGTLTIAGRTADGEKITGSTFVGPDGQVVLHVALYTPVKGSLSGVLDLNRGATAAEDTIGGSVVWTRPAATSTRTRLYQEGFGPLVLDPVGGRYVVPATGVFLGVDAGTQAELSFEEAGINPEANDPSVLVTLQAKNKVEVGTNPENTKVKANSKTGALTGSIVQPGNRKANFQALAVRTSPTTVDALGYFLLPQSTGEVLSGYVSLEPVAEEGEPVP